MIHVIAIITAKPGKTTGAEVRGAYGNYNQRKIDGYLNLGGDVLSARLAFAVKLRDGVVENIAGRPGSQTPNGPRNSAGASGFGSNVSS